MCVHKLKMELEHIFPCEIAEIIQDYANDHRERFATTLSRLQWESDIYVSSRGTVVSGFNSVCASDCICDCEHFRSFSARRHDSMYSGRMPLKFITVGPWVTCDCCGQCCDWDDEWTVRHRDCGCVFHWTCIKPYLANNRSQCPNCAASRTFCEACFQCGEIEFR